MFKKYPVVIRFLLLVLALPILMVAAPQYGTFSFLGLLSKRIYPVDAYHSDVADALVNFDAGAGASSSSPTSWTCPEPVTLIDHAIVTGMTDTTKIQILANNQPVGGFLRYTQHLTTSPTRSPVLTSFAAGVEFRAIQKA